MCVCLSGVYVCNCTERSYLFLEKSQTLLYVKNFFSKTKIVIYCIVLYTAFCGYWNENI